MKPKFSFDIDCDGRDATGRVGHAFASYGSISTKGNDLDDLLSNAMVALVDQDGGEVDIIAADEPWMQDLIVAEFEKRR